MVTEQQGPQCPQPPHLAEGKGGRRHPDEDVECVLHQLTLRHQHRRLRLQQGTPQGLELAMV